MTESDDNCISALRLDVFDPAYYDEFRRKKYWPEFYTKRSWIPQTIGDQVWALFEFRSIEDRLAWEKSLPDSISQWLDRSLIPWAKDFGWTIYDANGWPIDEGTHN